MWPTLALPYVFAKGWHGGALPKSGNDREPPLSRDSERRIIRLGDDEPWCICDRRTKKIGNPPLDRLNAQTVADGLQFVLSATKLPLTNAAGAELHPKSGSHND